MVINEECLYTVIITDSPSLTNDIFVMKVYLFPIPNLGRHATQWKWWSLISLRGNRKYETSIALTHYNQ
jgi:hypothetical protein